MTVENQIKTGGIGGIEVVAKAINLHITNVDICERGCAALRNITANNGNQSNTKQH